MNIEVQPILLNAVQYPINHSKSPLLPPNHFTYIDGRTEFEVKTSTTARDLYRQYSCFNSNRHNRRKFVDGAIYTKLFDDSVDIIYPLSNRIIELKIQHHNTNEISSVKIIYDKNLGSPELLAMNELGYVLGARADNTSQGPNNDKGKMHVVGRGTRGNGMVGTYKLTNVSTDVKDAVSTVMHTMKTYYENMYLTEDIEEIRDNALHGIMNCSQFFASSIVQSEDLINAGHYDIDDSSCSITTWTEKNIGQANGWYFVMPNTSRDGNKGTAIELRHGVTIRWDAHKIFHCSTVFKKGKSNVVYGTCVQSKKK